MFFGFIGRAARSTRRLSICLLALSLCSAKPCRPSAAAIMGTTLALLVIYGAHVEPVDVVLRDVDWKTIRNRMLPRIGQMFRVKSEISESLASRQFEEWNGGFFKTLIRRIARSA